MGTQDVLTYVALILTAISIVVALFTQSIRRWIIETSQKVIRYIHGQANQFWLRAVLLLFIYALLIVLLYKRGFLSLEFSIVISLVFVLWLVGIYFFLKPYRVELDLFRSDISKIKSEVETINKFRRSELEGIQMRWIDFIEMLSNHPGYEVVGAFLSLSKPLSIEDNILFVGLPEVVLKASRGIDLETVTDPIKDFFGHEYLLRPIVYDPNADRMD